LSGTPTQTGSFPIIVKATDSNGCMGTGATYTLTINCQAITVTNPVTNTGTASAAFSQTFTQTDGIGTTTFSTTSTLPTGITLSSGGVLSGTPTQTGTFPITVIATDSNGCMGTSVGYTLTISCQAITVSNPVTNTGTAGTAFSQTFTQTDGIGTTTFSTTSSLPTGLTLSSGGTLSGTPTQTGSFPITVEATDTNGCMGTGATYTLTINCPTITVNVPVNNNGGVNMPFSETFTQTGGIGLTTFSTTSTLPTGITLATGGVLSGTTLQVGSFPITVKATDANGCMGTSATYTLTITNNSCPSLLTVNDLGDTPDALPGDNLCADASNKCTLRAAIMEANAINVCTPLTVNFSVMGTINLVTALPNLNHPNLTIAGPGANLLSIVGDNASTVFILNMNRTAAINNLTVTGGRDTAGRGGGIANRGTLTLTNVIVSGNTSSGAGGAGGLTSSGTLTLVGSTVSNNSGTGDAAAGGLFATGTTGLTDSTVSGNTNSFAAGIGGIVQSGGTLTLTNSTVSGNRTADAGGGLLVSANGTANLLNSTITANHADNNDSGGIGKNGGGIKVVLGAVTLLNTIVADNFRGSGTATADDVRGSLTANHSFIGNTTGATISGGNNLSGNPLLGALGNYGGPTQVHALLPGSPAINTGTSTGAPSTDQRGFARGGNVDIGAVEAQAFTLAITGGNHQSAVVDTAFAAPLQVNLKEGANNLPGAEITFTAPGSGASLNPVSGMATTDASGNASYAISANGVAGGPYPVNTTTGALSQPFSLTNVFGAPAQLAFGQHPSNTPAAASVSPAVTVRVLDAFGNLTNSTAAITMGLGANPGAAALSGTTTVNALNGVATFNSLSLNKIGTGYTLAASSVGLAGVASLPFNITCPSITLSSLAAGTAGTAYNQTVMASPIGGNYTFAVTGGALPANLTLASNGTITGVPTTAGTFNFTITAMGFASGQGSCTGVQTYNLVILCPTITLTPASLPNGVQGTAYNQTVTAAPVGTTYSYAVTTNMLPPGLSLNSATGAITGTPTAAGNYVFGITATGWASGSGSCTKSQSYSLLITGTCTAITLSPTSLPGAPLGTVYSQSITAAGGVLPYSYSVSGGALPAGLSLSSSGLLSGTPTAAGTFVFTIKAVGQGGCAGTRSYVLSVACATLTFTPNSLPNGSAGTAYSQALNVTPGTGYVFSLLLGGLPPGFTLSSAGVLSGTTSQAGTYNLTVKAIAGSCQGIKAYTLVIGASAAALAQKADYDGDGKSDFALWSNDATWRVLLSNDTAPRQAHTPSWGTTGDLTLLGDYDGDGKSDLAVFRPSNGTWYVKHSSNGSLFVKAWGTATDVPVPGDYDGDGKTDLAVFRPSEGHWYVLRSSDQRSEVTAWGAGYAPYNDVAVPSDYDGDGKTDVAVFRRATGTWLVKRSSDGQFSVKQWGLGTDVPVAADYDGDGRTDFAVWRGTTWYIWQSTTNAARTTDWGTHETPYFDQAVPGDYDGDGQADVAVWRAANASWYLLLSAAENRKAASVVSFGQTADRPISTHKQ
jgi:hypothetical protein